jgi:hypothetical protein
MAFQSGFTDQTGTTGFAHREMLLRIKTLAEANGWTTLRYTTTVPDSHELILRGVGLSGTEEIFVGVRTYENVASDYYNLAVAGFTGYVGANAWSAQPGFLESGIPCHNQRCDYWLAINAQRIAFALKVGTPVYESGYIGKYLPYALPTQYPYPLCVGGMLNGAAATRYSDTAHSMPYKGSRTNFRVRWFDGTWKQPETHPWDNLYIGGVTAQLRDTGAVYPVMPVQICDNTPNIYGVLDGVGYVSNFNNTVESTVSADGSDWVCIQDVGRTSFNDYYALRMS